MNENSKRNLNELSAEELKAELDADMVKIRKKYSGCENATIICGWFANGDDFGTATQGGRIQLTGLGHIISQRIAAGAKDPDLTTFSQLFGK